MIGRRLYRLRPWVVRALIPTARTGSYVLYDHEDGRLRARYNGRSDHDVAGRLAQHARAGRGDYFSYDVHATRQTAFLVECAGYHLRLATATNVIHPATPRGLALDCPFCRVRDDLDLSVPAVSEHTPATANRKED